MRRSLGAFLILIHLSLQDAVVTKLTRPTAELGEAFTFVSSLRELRDGRVLLTDPRQNEIVVADFASNRLQRLARVGSGPGEYTRAAPIYPLNGDSSIMADMLSRRWLILFHDRVIATLPPDLSAILAVSDEVVMSSDGRGSVLSRKYPPNPTGKSTTTNKDSVWIVRVGVATGRLDTVVRVRAAPVTTEIARNAKGEVTSMRQSVPNPYGIEEPVAACTDGWLAVVRLDPYRVEWRSPSGSWTRGAALQHESDAMTEGEKRALMTRLAAATGSQVRPADQYSDWPARIPPVEPRSLFTAICSPDGTVLVNRAKSIKHPESRYDVIDRRGTRLRQIALAGNEHLVGFGNRTVYSVRTDEDGAQHVRRYSWP